jgi:hypothetical protein
MTKSSLLFISILVFVLQGSFQSHARPWIIETGTEIRRSSSVPVSTAYVSIDVEGDFSLEIRVTSYSTLDFSGTPAKIRTTTVTRNQLEAKGGIHIVSSLGHTMSHEIRVSNCRSSAIMKLVPNSQQTGVTILRVENPVLNAPRSRPPVTNISVVESYGTRTISYQTETCASTTWSVNNVAQSQFHNQRSITCKTGEAVLSYISNEWGTMTLWVSENGAYQVSVYN